MSPHPKHESDEAHQEENQSSQAASDGSIETPNHALNNPDYRTTDNFEYLLAILRNDSLVNTRVFMKIVVGEAVKKERADIPSTTLYSGCLINEVAKLLHKKIHGSVNISRDAATNIKFHPFTAPPSQPDVNIRLIGSDIIEGDDFVYSLAQLVDYEQIEDYLFKTFVTDNHASLMNNLLGVATAADIYGVKDNSKLPNVPNMWLDKPLLTSGVNRFIVLSAFIANMLKDILLEDMPELLIGIKVNAFYVDLVVSHQADDEIFFDGWNEEPSQYHHVYFKGFKDGALTTYGTTAVRSNGMFNRQHLQALLALKNDLEHVILVSWQDLKDEKTYNAFNGR